MERQLIGGNRYWGGDGLESRRLDGKAVVLRQQALHSIVARLVGGNPGRFFIRTSQGDGGTRNRRARRIGDGSKQSTTEGNRQQLTVDGRDRILVDLRPLLHALKAGLLGADVIRAGGHDGDTQV